jgi:DNA primase
MAPEPILCFDGDAAGIRAAQRALDLALPMLGPDRSLRFALLPEATDPDDLIGRAGPDAMRQVLDAATPLVDMLWDRETEDRRFDTPERRAGLEKRLDAAALSIGDEAVRRHYKDALAARLRAFFGEGQKPAPRNAPARRPFRRPNDDWRSAQSRGPTTPRYRPADPTPISAQLRRRFRTGGAAGPTLAEATMLTTPIHHPALLHRHLDEFLSVEFDGRELEALRRAIVTEAAENQEETPLVEALSGAGFGGLLARLDDIVQRAGSWQALSGADDGDAEQSWLQAITLHRRARALHKELAQAQAAYAGDMSEPNFARMIEIQRQLTNAEGIEASIEGFGRSSGHQAQDY